MDNTLSSMIVFTLISAVLFTYSITVPGNNNHDEIPVSISPYLFMLCFIAQAVSSMFLLILINWLEKVAVGSASLVSNRCGLLVQLFRFLLSPCFCLCYWSFHCLTGTPKSAHLDQLCIASFLPLIDLPSDRHFRSPIGRFCFPSFAICISYMQSLD